MKKEKPPSGRMLTIPEAAKYLGISTRHIRNLIADSTLTGYRIGDTGNIRLRLDEVEAAIQPVHLDYRKAR